MSDTTSREQILKRVRNASMKPIENPYSDVDLDSNVYMESEEDLEVIFAEELSKVNGQFIYCENEQELRIILHSIFVQNQWTSALVKDAGISNILDQIKIQSFGKLSDYTKVDVSLSSCEALIARLGSVLVSSANKLGRRVNFIGDTHIVLAHRHQIVESVKDAMKLMEEKYGKTLPSMVSVMTGPSRTADIEKTLVMGAHGPKQLMVILCEENFFDVVAP